MNWTGGRLQRHSKANADPLIKAQKQRFAQSRSKQLNGDATRSPARFSILNSIQLDVQTAAENHRTRRRATHFRQSDLIDQSSNSPRDRRGSNASPALYDTGKSSPNHRNLDTPSKCEIIRQNDSLRSATKEPNALEAMKRNLLRKSDWLGISAAKPVHMDFPSPEELASVGKRRKITHEDRTRQNQGQKRDLAPASLQDWRRIRECKDNTISVRIGSDIHKSQPTVTATPQQLAQASQASSESMLLDRDMSRSDTHKPNGLKDHIDRDMEVDGRGAEAQDMPTLRQDHMMVVDAKEDEALPTLENFLGIENFDQVREKSASHSSKTQGHTASIYPSSPPPQPSCDNVLKNPFASIGSGNGNGFDRMQSYSLTNTQYDARILNEEQDQSHASSSNEGGNQLPTMQPWQLASPHQQSRPTFTLDEQVLEERRQAAHLGVSQEVIHQSTNNPRTDATTDYQHSKLGSARIPLQPNMIASRVVKLQKRPFATQPKRSTETSGQFLTTAVDGPLTEAGSSMREPLPGVAGTPNSRAEQRQYNAKWMQFVLGDELDEINQGFHYGPRGQAYAYNSKRRRVEDRHDSDSSSSFPAWTWTTGPTSQTSKKILTSANTVLNDRSSPEARLQPSETNFLSQLSPMEGVIDDRLQNISVYNNAARTERSFLSFPSPEHRFITHHNSGSKTWERHPKNNNIRTNEQRRLLSNTAWLPTQPESASRSSKDTTFAQPRHSQQTPSFLSTIAQRSYSTSSPLTRAVHPTRISDIFSSPRPKALNEKVSNYFRTPHWAQSEPSSHVHREALPTSALADASSTTEPAEPEEPGHIQSLLNIHATPSRNGDFVFRKPLLYRGMQTMSHSESNLFTGSGTGLGQELIKNTEEGTSRGNGLFRMPSGLGSVLEY